MTTSAPPTHYLVLAAQLMHVLQLFERERLASKLAVGHLRSLVPCSEERSRIDVQTYGKLITIHQLHSILIEEIHQDSLLPYA